jgi:hypothetical protein
MMDSPVYQKEIGMKVLGSHDAVIGISNDHLDLSSWPVADSAILQKLKLEEKYEPVLVTKSQLLFASGVEITVSGKRRRLDNVDDDGDDLSLIADLDALTSLT